MDPKPIKKILVVGLDNLGDAVMGTCVFRPLRHAFPHAKIGYWVKTHVSELFNDYSLCDTLHAADPFWDDAPGHPKGRFRNFRNTMDEISREKYDLCVILKTDWKRSLVCWWMKIPIRVGHRRRKSQFFLTQAIPRISDQHMTQENLSLVESLTTSHFPSDMLYPRLELSDSEIHLAQDWIEKQGWVDNPLIVCHPFGGRAYKWWPMISWLDLLNKLNPRIPRARFVFICDKTEGSRLVDAINLAPRGTTTVLVGEHLSFVKSVIGTARLFIGGDSGPGHMAAALGKPVISLFSRSNFTQYAPRGHAPVKVLKKDPLSRLESDVVLEAVLDVMKEEN